MFVEGHVIVAQPVKRVGEILSTRAHEVERLGIAAYRHGEQLSAEVDPGSSLALQVLISIGSARNAGAGLAFPVTWRATRAAVLFPRLHGDLYVVPEPPSSASISLQALYTPPLGWVGDVLDRRILSRFTNAAVSWWLEQLARSVEVDSERADGLLT